MSSRTGGAEAKRAIRTSCAQPAAGQSLWRNGDFLKLWTGETVAQIGAQVTELALPLLVLGGLGGSAAQVGLVGAMQFLPALCVTPCAGLLIDMFNRRGILLSANLLRALALLLVPVLLLVGVLTIPALSAIAFVVGAGTAVFDIAYLAYLPALVPQQHLVEANSKMQGAYSVAQIGGPGLGGALVKAIGAWFAILVNVVTYLVAFGTLLSIKKREPRRDPAASGRPRLADIVTSFGLLWRDRVLRVLTLQAGWYNLCQQAIMTLFLVYAVKRLLMNAGGVGLVLALGSVASLGGAVVARRAGIHFGFPRILVVSMAAAVLAPLLLLPTGSVAVVDFALAALSFAVAGVGMTVYNVHVVAFRQSVIPSDVLGRATAAYRMLTYGPLSLGAFLGGLLGERIGLWNAIVVFAVGSIVGWSLFALACRKLPTSPSVAALTAPA